MKDLIGYGPEIQSATVNSYAAQPESQKPYACAISSPIFGSSKLIRYKEDEDLARSGSIFRNITEVKAALVATGEDTEAADTAGAEVLAAAANGGW